MHFIEKHFLHFYKLFYASFNPDQKPRRHLGISYCHFFASLSAFLLVMSRPDVVGVDEAVEVVDEVVEVVHVNVDVNVVIFLLFLNKGRL